MKICGDIDCRLTLWLPRTKKMWPSRTSEQAVSLFRSSALDIFKVSLRNLLLLKVYMIRFLGLNITSCHFYSVLTKMKSKVFLLGLIVTSLEERQEPSDVKSCSS